jgi:signal transduction histidine kinase
MSPTTLISKRSTTASGTCSMSRAPAPAISYLRDHFAKQPGERTRSPNQCPSLALSQVLTLSAFWYAAQPGAGANWRLRSGHFLAGRKTSIPQSIARLLCGSLSLLKADWCNTTSRTGGRADPVMKPAEEIIAAVHVEQVGATFQHVPIAVVVNVTNAGITATVLAAISPTNLSFVWFGAVTLVSVGRWLLWRLYQRASPQVQKFRAWEVLVVVGSFLAGLSWGLGGAVLLPATPGFGRTFLITVIGGMCAGGAVLNVPHLPTLLAFLLSASLPVASRLFATDSMADTALAAMITVFAVALSLAGAYLNRFFTVGLRLRFELNQAIISLRAEMAEHQEIEAILRQAQKLEAVGQLTGGIAHDFTNLLTAVVNYVELAIRRAENNPAIVPLLQGAVQAADRGIVLVERLLAFARKQRLEPRAIDVKALISNVEELLRRTLGGTINLEIAIDPDLAPARVDANQLELAVLNLAINARDAMPSGGTMRLSVENSQTGRSKPAGLAPADYIIVSITDTGIGMDEATLARAFDPFFTTKKAGSGSGLGLSMVQGFAIQSGGGVQIQSVLGEGTRVDVWLPRAEEASAVPDSPNRPGISGPRRAARILLCDDDPHVRDSLGKFLQAEGYIVHLANSPSAALRILEMTAEVDLLIVDYGMPEMNGLELIREARQRCPGLKTLLITGHVGVLSGGISGVAVLPKPFGPAQLGLRIAEILTV